MRIPISRKLRRQKKADRSIIGTTEWHVLLTAFALILLYLAILSIGYIISPPTANLLTAITVTNVLFGRAAGMSLGYAMGFGQALVIPLNIFIESVIVLLFYPLFVFSCQHLIHFRKLNEFIARAKVVAERNRRLVNRYGLLGLFAFVWFPLSMTGPMVGCIIGYLMGLSTKVNLTVVLASTSLAIISWALLLRGMLEKLAAYSTYAPITIITTAMALVVIIHVYRSVKKNKEGFLILRI